MRGFTAHRSHYQNVGLEAVFKFSFRLRVLYYKHLEQLVFQSVSLYPVEYF